MAAPLHHITETDIANRARETLSALYDLQIELVGVQPTMEDFFPINLRQIVEDVLTWQIEERTDIGYLPTGHLIIGQTNYVEKRILLDVGNTSEGERNFTLAHEIGHITLHPMNYSCHGFATRAHSKRQNERLLNPEPSRARLEREAQIFAAELLMPRKSVSLRLQEMFGKDRIWSEGALAKRILEQSNMRSRYPRLKEIAKAIGTHKDSEHAKNLSDFFGVSGDAMAVRLMRLKVVF